jgi:hypothetical protein
MRSRKVTPDEMKFWRIPLSSPLTWAFGGGDGIRTHGLYIANVALCQLSYTPGGPQNSRALRGARRSCLQWAAARGTSKSSSSQAPGYPAIAVWSIR